MNLLNYKRSVFYPVLLLVVIALALTGCGGDDDSEVQHAVVRLQINNQTHSENVYQYYWPQTAENVVYDVNYDALTIDQYVPVAADDTVRFAIFDGPTDPAVFTATLLDGSDQAQDLTASDGVYNAELPDGTYTVQVDVEYTDVKGHEAFVSYVYGLEVAGVIPPTPTPTLTPTPTSTSTPTPTPTATNTALPTNTPMPTATEPPTATPTVPPTDTPVPTVTAEPDMTGLTTDETPTTETAISTVPAAGDLGQFALTGQVQLATNGTTATVAGATVSYTHNSTANPDRTSAGKTTTDADGQFVFDPILLNTSDQIVVRAEAPGYQMQIIQRSGLETFEVNGVFSFVLQPVMQETPTPTPLPITATATRRPTATRQPPPANIPDMMLLFAGQTYYPAGYSFCERGEAGERICVDLPMEDASRGRVKLQRGAAAELRIEGPRPDEILISYLSDLGETTGQPQMIPGDNIVLFTITPEPGSYIMTVRVTWADTDATYYFRITVSD